MRVIEVTDPGAVEAALESLRGGGVLALPTDTVYGLACDAANGRAVAKIFSVKGRGEEKPLTLFVSNAQQALAIGRPASREHEAALRKLWPGAVTAILRAARALPPKVTGRGGTIGIRVPDHPFCLGLLQAFGGPLATTSANRSGEAELWDSREVVQQFAGALELVIDGGVLPPRAPSVVVDLSVVPAAVLRGGEREAEVARLFGIGRGTPGVKPDATGPPR